MNRGQLLRKLKKHCRNAAIRYDWNSGEGKGSHGTVYIGDLKTVIKNGELTNDYIDALLKQLGLKKGIV